MRLSTRLLSNAATTYLRLGSTLVLGLFTTWYILGTAGVVGFGLIALSTSANVLAHALEMTFRFGLVQGLAAAIAGGEQLAIRRSLRSATRLSFQVTAFLIVATALLTGAAWLGLFNTPDARPELRGALVVLILGEGLYAIARLAASPYLRALFAAQKVALDNLLMVVSRATYALSAVLVFGWALPEADLPTQLVGYALSRVTLQLADVVVGIWLARRYLPISGRDDSSFDEAQYRSMRQTVWQWSQVGVLLTAIPQFLAIVINLVFGVAYNGLWQIAVQFSGYAWMLSSGLLHGLVPITAHLRESGRLQAMVDLVTRSIRYQLAVALPAAIVLGLFAHPLLDLWVGHRITAESLPASGDLSPSQALQLTVGMSLVLLAAQTVRAGFFSVERILFGLGNVKSYAWFAKWAALIALGCGAALSATFLEPALAPVGLLVSNTLFSVVLLVAARRVLGLSIRVTLFHSIPRPFLAGLLFLAVLVPVHQMVGQMTMIELAGLLVVSTVIYGILALTVVAQGDERRRVAQLLGQAWARVKSRKAGTS